MENHYLGQVPPTDWPISFLADLIPADQIAHAGVFTPDLLGFYFTLSNKQFSQFDVMFITFENGCWTTPRPAFFNSVYLEHGVHFSVDNQWAYFSSTRPRGTGAVSDDWGIWRSRRTGHGWSAPEFVAIPGMEGRVFSHPSITTGGRLYFHSYNQDFSDMSLFSASPIGERFSTAEKIELPDWKDESVLTAFIAPDESYLLFTKKWRDMLTHEIYISRRAAGEWQLPIKLSDAINTNNLGNPFVTSDGQYLFYAAGFWPTDAPAHDWLIKWVSTEALPKKRH